MVYIIEWKSEGIYEEIDAETFEKACEEGYRIAREHFEKNIDIIVREKEENEQKTKI